VLPLSVIAFLAIPTVTSKEYFQPYLSFFFFSISSMAGRYIASQVTGMLDSESEDELDGIVEENYVMKIVNKKRPPGSANAVA